MSSSNRRVLTSKLPPPGHPVPLSEGEATHLIRVLRLRDGDEIEALDGQGRSARVTLRFAGESQARIEFLDEPETLSSHRVPPVQLEMAVLKGEAMEWVIEKAVELGVQRVIPVLTAHTVVKTGGKDPEAFRGRWQKIADQSLKQCGRLDRMLVELPVPLGGLLTRQPEQDPWRNSPRLWFDEAGRPAPTLSNPAPDLADWLARSPDLPGARLLVGPEGGWSEPERALLGSQTPPTVRLSLGPWVLRAETAALFAISLTTSHFRQNP